LEPVILSGLELTLLLAVATGAGVSRRFVRHVANIAYAIRKVNAYAINF